MKFYRSLPVWSAIAILLLTGCRERDSNSSRQSASASGSPSLERYLFIRNDKFGYIDRAGKIAIPAKFDRADRFSEGLAGVSIGTQDSTIDLSGKIVAVGWPPPKSTPEKNQDLNLVEQNGKYGYADRAGKIVIAPKFYYAADEFADGMAWIIDNKYRLGYINKRGDIVVAPQYDYRGGSGAGNFDSAVPTLRERGLARVCLRGKCGYIDRSGKQVIPLQFEDAAAKFSDGLAWVKIGNKIGYINRAGKVIIPAQFGYPGKGKAGSELGITKCANGYCFSAPTDFNRGLAAVVIPGICRSLGTSSCDRYGYIDTKGKSIFEF